MSEAVYRVPTRITVSLDTGEITGIGYADLTGPQLGTYIQRVHRASRQLLEDIEKAKEDKKDEVCVSG
jgi:hypothetical protein